MNSFERYSKSLLWLMAVLLAFIMTGCGDGGGSSGSGIQVFNQDAVPGAPGAIAPGTLPSGTTGGTGTAAAQPAPQSCPRTPPMAPPMWQSAPLGLATRLSPEPSAQPSALR